MQLIKISEQLNLAKKSIISTRDTLDTLNNLNRDENINDELTDAVLQNVSYNLTVISKCLSILENIQKRNEQ